jgi:hypothetical protein
MTAILMADLVQTMSSFEAAVAFKMAKTSSRVTLLFVADRS